MKLIFIHHSTGENWLADYDGGLGIALRNNNYRVSDTNYGWGPDGIGDLTDIGHWWLWFRGPNRIHYTSALFIENGRHCDYSRLPDPGGENEIVMFKSCFPNSHLSGNPNDLPNSGTNLLRGKDAASSSHSVANAKGIYNDLLVYFSLRQDKLFIVISAPPLSEQDTDASHAQNARAFNNWLVNEWLKEYAYHNVAVFDFYNVLTSNRGSRALNDLGMDKGNHHRVWENKVQHVQSYDSDFSAYPSGDWDSHPNTPGNLKAAAEFSSLLNVYYHCWKGTGDCPGVESVNLPPVVSAMSANPVMGYVPFEVDFICEAHDPDGEIVEYRWDFNEDGIFDLSTGSGVTSYRFESTGSFSIICTVVDDKGDSARSSPITIECMRRKRTKIRR